jgi:hypothetical protein
MEHLNVRYDSKYLSLDSEIFILIVNEKLCFHFNKNFVSRQIEFAEIEEAS